MKKIILFCLALIAFAGAKSQKIPNKQEASVRAPAGVKVDGKATEWGDFKAYNSAIEVYYTIANDDKNLYLVIQATDPLVARKIIAGGITFSIGIPGKENVAVTYPLYDRTNPPNFNLKNKASFAANSARADSFMTASNKEIVRNARQIKVIGFKTFTDTLLSIYNEEGVTVTAQFNNRLAYTYELALPLKYLNVTAVKGDRLNYTIKLNGSAYAEGSYFEHIEGGMRVSSKTVWPIPTVQDMQFISAQTDMSGTYALAP